MFRFLLLLNIYLGRMNKLKHLTYFPKKKRYATDLGSNTIRIVERKIASKKMATINCTLLPSMGKFFLQQAINPGARNSTKQCHDHN
jgi:hypothetical protein